MLQTIARPPLSATLLNAGDGAPMRVELRGQALAATSGGVDRVALRLDDADLELDAATGDVRADERALSAVFEALFGWQPELAHIGLRIASHVPAAAALAQNCLRSGLVRQGPDGLSVHPETFMQRRPNWMVGADLPPYPLDYAMSEGRRHPRRPPKPDGMVYVRYIPWLDRSMSFRVLTLDDLPLFSRWMNDPRIAAFWNEAGTIEAHRDYLTKLIADPHMLPLIGCCGDQPFAYFEIYWAKENRIAPFYDVDDYDRGWHVAVGEDAFRGRRFVSAWLPSLMHYMFLDDPRTQRIVGEPAATHVQQIRNLEMSGFAKLKTFDFPHKRAMLVMLTRERFFGDRLWLPAPETTGTTPPTVSG